MVFFVTHCLGTLATLVAPIILARFAVIQERAKVDDEQVDDEQQIAKYSLLQLQAKCPPYEFLSWGGSKADDFMKLATGFALLTCFGVILPVMAVPAFICTMAEYRLIAYRMTVITRRPSPLGAEGIGIWQDVFATLEIIAVGVNVGLVVAVMFPMRHWTHLHELAAFIILEHAFLAIRACIAACISDEPEDVRRIFDFNSRFLSKLRWKGRDAKPLHETTTNKAVDLDFGHMLGRDSETGAVNGYLPLPCLVADTTTSVGSGDESSD